MSEFNENKDINTDTRSEETIFDQNNTEDDTVSTADESSIEDTVDIVTTDSETAEDKKAFKKKKFFTDITDYVEVIAISIAIVVLVFSCLFRTCKVEGDSMKGTLIDGENLIATNFFYTPKSGDIIVFHETQALDKPVVKRIIAVEGQTVTINYLSNTMKVSVTDADGETVVLEEDYITYEYQRYFGEKSYVVPEGCVFVMGDNRNDSMDSRDPSIGYVDTRTILGRVIFRISPINKFGTVK